jgi:hypothetical protein
VANLSSSPAQNIFELRIKAKKLSTLDKLYSFPDVSNFTSSKSMPYLVILSIENGAGPLMDSGVSLSDNASCLDAPFTYEVKNSRPPEGNAIAQGNSEDVAASAATCATISIDDDSDGQQPPFAMSLFLGFACISLLVRIRKKAIKFLS